MGQSINARVTASQAASESAAPHLAIVPPGDNCRQTIERPIEAAAWESMRFMARCNSQRVAGGYEAKAFFLALAGRCATLEQTDTGSFRIRRVNLLHALQCSKGTFYKWRRILEDQGLVEIRRTAKSTEVTVLANRHMAEAPPFQRADVPPVSEIRCTTRVGNQMYHPVGTSDVPPVCDIHIQGSVQGVTQGVERGAPSPSSESSPTHTCPQCKRSWPESYGDVCFDCNATITEIRRRLEQLPGDPKYMDVSVQRIGEEGQDADAIAWEEKQQEERAERERIHDIQRAEYQRREEERRKQEQERRDQEQDPEWQAEQKRKADEAHELRLKTLNDKHSGRTV